MLRLTTVMQRGICKCATKFSKNEKKLFKQFAMKGSARFLYISKPTTIAYFSTLCLIRHYWLGHIALLVRPFIFDVQKNNRWLRNVDYTWVAASRGHCVRLTDHILPSQVHMKIASSPKSAGRHSLNRL